MAQKRRANLRPPRVQRTAPVEAHAPPEPEAAEPDAAPRDLAVLQRALGNAGFARMMSSGAPIARMPRPGGSQGNPERTPSPPLYISRAPTATVEPPAPAPAPSPTTGAAVPGAPGVTVAKAPDPGGVQLYHTGAQMAFSDNKDYVRYQLEKLVTSHNQGLDRVGVFENSDFGFKFSDELGPQFPALGGPTTPADITPEARTEYRKKVGIVVREQVDQLKKDVSDFRTYFERMAGKVLNDMLDDSETRLKDMLVKYGIKEESWALLFTEHVAEKTDKNTELVKAAGSLVQKYEEVLKADRELQAAKANRGPGPDEPDAGTEGKAAPGEAEVAAQNKLFELQGEYTQQLETQKGIHPILAVYTLDNDKAFDRLKALASGNLKGMAEVAGKEIAEKLKNIQTVREKWGSNKELVWKLEKVMETTKRLPGVQDWEFLKNREVQRQTVAEEQGKHEAVDQLTTVAIGVVAFAVGLIATAPVGAAVAAAAGGADAAIAITGTISAIQKYQFETAAQGTDVDKARAIMQGEEPSLFWLAVDIAASVVAVKGGLKAGRALFQQVTTLKNEAVALKAVANTAEAEGGTAKAALDGKLKQLEEAGNAARPGDGAKLVEEVKNATTPATGAAKAMTELLPKFAEFAGMEGARAEALVAESITKMGMPATVEAAGGYAALEAKLGAKSASLEKIRAWRQTVLEEMAEEIGRQRAPAAAADVSGGAGISVEDARKILARVANMAPEAVEKLLGTELSQIAKLEKAANYALKWKHFFLQPADARTRLNALMGVINPILEEAGVPPMFYQGLKKGAGAAFEHSAWGMEIGVNRLADAQTLLQKAVLTEQEFNALVGVAYHEARHAEQSWLMARRMSGDGMFASTIARKMGIPEDIAELAVHAPPLKKGMPGADLAEKWIESMYGKGPTGAAYREEVYKMKDQFKAQYMEASKKVDQLAKENAKAVLQLRARNEMEAALKEWRKWDALYRELPEEADAYLAQAMFDKTMAEFTAGPATAPRPKPSAPK